MLNAAAYQKALHAFNRTRANVGGRLKAAISAYREEDLHQICTQRSVGPVDVYIADTETGDLAVAVSGFKTLGEAELFLRERVYEAGK